MTTPTIPDSIEQAAIARANRAYSAVYGEYTPVDGDAGEDDPVADALWQAVYDTAIGEWLEYAESIAGVSVHRLTQATNYDAWGEFVDTAGVYSAAAFDAMTVPERLAIIDAAFGADHRIDAERAALAAANAAYGYRPADPAWLAVYKAHWEASHE